LSTAINKTHRIYRQCIGFSLIQVLVSLALSLLILAGFFSWHHVVKTLLIESKEKRSYLNTGSTALQLMMNDLSRSGYRGCRSMDENYPVRLHAVSHVGSYQFYRLDTAVIGFVANGACRFQLPETACERIKTGSDVLVIHNIPHRVTALKQPIINADAEVYVTAEGSIRKRSLVLVNDCYAADIFVATSVDKDHVQRKISSKRNQSRQLSKAYQAGTEVVELESVAYYVSDENTLFRDNLFNKAEEILTGVDSLQIEYALAEGDGRIQYLRSEKLKVSDWPWVVGVRVKLTTERAKVWEYEFSIRNRRHSDLSFGAFNFNFGNDVSFNDNSVFKFAFFS